jgi:hypothetical protein
VTNLRTVPPVVANPEAVGDPTTTPVVRFPAPQRRERHAHRRLTSHTAAVGTGGERIELISQLNTMHCLLHLVDLDEDQEPSVELDRQAARDLRDALTAFLERGGV